MPPVPDSSLTGKVIGCAIEVHRHLGPGLLGDVYELCLCEELANAGLPFVRQCVLPVRYKGRLLEQSFQMDIVVASALVLDIKAVAELHPLHEARVLTYLRLSGYRLGLLLNFNAPRLTDGIRRVVCSADGFEESHEPIGFDGEPAWVGRL